MTKKRRVKRMSPTSIIDFATRKKAKKASSSTTTKKMSQESIKSSYDFKKRSWERD